MSQNKGHEKTVVEPVFNDIDLEKSSPNNEPPPPYKENESPQMNRIYPVVSSPLSQQTNQIQSSPVFTTPVITTTVIREKCHHKRCCVEELLVHSRTFFCKHCNVNVQSTLSYENGSRYMRRLIILLVISLFCPIFIICLLMALLSNRYRDITHRCPYCHNILGIHHSC